MKALYVRLLLLIVLFAQASLSFGQKDKDKRDKEDTQTLRLIEQKLRYLESQQKYQVDALRNQMFMLVQKDTAQDAQTTRLLQQTLEKLNQSYQQQIEQVKEQKSSQETETNLLEKYNYLQSEVDQQGVTMFVVVLGTLIIFLLIVLLVIKLWGDKQRVVLESFAKQNQSELRLTISDVLHTTQRNNANIVNTNTPVVETPAETTTPLDVQAIEKHLKDTLIHEVEEKNAQVMDRISGLENKLFEVLNAFTTAQNNQNSYTAVNTPTPEPEPEEVSRDFSSKPSVEIEDQDPYYQPTTVSNNEQIQEEEELESVVEEPILETEEPLEEITVPVQEPKQEEKPQEEEKDWWLEQIEQRINQALELEERKNNLNNTFQSEEKVSEVSEDSHPLETEQTIIQEQFEAPEEEVLEEETPDSIFQTPTYEEKVSESQEETEEEEIIYDGKSIEEPKQTSLEVEKWTQLGMDAYERKEFDKAIEYYTYAIDQQPDFLAFTRRANCYHIQRKYDKAAADYQRAIRLNTDFIPAYNNAIEIYILTDNFFQALTMLEQLSRIEKSYSNKAVELYLKLITQKALMQSTEKTERELDILLRENFTFSFSVKEIEDWLQTADIDINDKRIIRVKTELLKMKREYANVG